MENPNEKVCPRCGNILQGEESFCPRCGQSMDQGAALEGIPAEAFNKAVREKKKKSALIAAISAAAVLAVVVIAVAAFILVPKFIKSPEEYTAVGDYEKAYSVSKDDAREVVVKENLVAFIAKDIPDALKDPASFSLREAWYDEEAQAVVLYVNGANSYGAAVSSYWYYTYSADNEGYELYTTVSDLESEETNDWDDTAEKLEKVLNNMARIYIGEIIADPEAKLEKASVKNINHLFEEGLLEEVELLDESKSEAKNE